MKKIRYHMHFRKGLCAFAALLLLTALCACSDPIAVRTSSDFSGPSSAPVDPVSTQTPSEPEADACAHARTKTLPEVAATCTTDGYKDRKQCLDCGQTLDESGEILFATGHAYEDRKCRFCKKNEPSLMREETFPDSDVKWQLFDDGELIVTGSGAIAGFPEKQNAYFYQYNKFIKSIVILQGVTEIGDCVFRNLKDVTDISISSTVTEIGDHAFDGWSLKTLNLSWRLKRVGKMNFTGSQLFFLELPGSLTFIGANSFDSAQMITLRVPASVKEFEAPEPGRYAGLDHVAFTGTKAQFDRLAFAQYLYTDGSCALVELYFEYNDKASQLPYCVKRGQISGDFTYAAYTDNTARITGYRGSSEEIEIPEKVGTCKVVAIHQDCFKENTRIRKVTLPATCTKICKQAFWKSSLEELTVKADHLLVGLSAFDDCKSFSVLHFDGVFKDVGAKAFANTKVENIRLDASMRVVRDSAFAHSAIKDVDFSRFRVICDSAFGYTSITEDLVLTGVQRVGAGAFYRAGIRTLDVTGVRFIGTGAFASNGSLTAGNVKGLDTVETIEPDAFSFKT